MSQLDRGPSSTSVEGGAPVVYLPWVQHDEVEAPEPNGAVPHTERPHTSGLRREKPSARDASLLIESLQLETDEADRADALVLKKLARTGMSQREVEIELGRELSYDQVMFNVERYLRLGYIDDERLADQIVRKQRSGKGIGSNGVRRELGRRGIPDGVIERVMSEFSSDDDFDRAVDLAESRLRRLSHESLEVQQRRILSFLMRRGYAADLSNRAFTQARQALTSD